MTDELVARAAHRAEITERAAADMARLGVDAAFVDRLVETFYGRIRAHEMLGPVFEARLSGRWPEHMTKMKAFWSSVAFKTGAYGGKPVQAHLGVEGMYPELFQQWLALFRQTLEDLTDNPQAHAWFMATAERIARSLAMALFYNPALDDPARHPNS
ncbi:truncated hemoglobin [Ciceribacter sp. L1K22]|uniref:group III truncated hemoglobin n=1 Tax=Ciceribacter sp. L1K22 TaxID=2820275 RepID=UPI001ABE67E9|nr:truncated hemoglobin [Ciceribacter sp. L1K22]MBO3758661.1 truncated hemoglobin [Ciceribacter sp. L1K22]